MGAGFDRSAARSELAQPGKVHLVGAGPGDPELLTIRAARLIAAADVILHDELVTAEILAIAHPGARLVNVGKRSGAPSTGQDHIHRLLVEAARSGAMVVRLKGGDPFIFGRGGEEVEALRAEGVTVEIVPGITAALGCAAQAQLPLTFRNEAVQLTFLTAHRADAGELDYAPLAAPTTTLAVYMGKETAGSFSRKLIAAGRPADTPVAVIINGTRPDEKTLTGTLANLASLAAAAGKAPALIIVGEVVRHSAPWIDELRGQSETQNAA